jgi:hypothetical protein
VLLPLLIEGVGAFLILLWVAIVARSKGRARPAIHRWLWFLIGFFVALVGIFWFVIVMYLAG